MPREEKSDESPSPSIAVLSILVSLLPVLTSLQLQDYFIRLLFIYFFTVTGLVTGLFFIIQ